MDLKSASAPKSLMGLIEKGGGTSMVTRRWGQTSRAMSGTSVADESLRACASGVGTLISGARVFGCGEAGVYCINFLRRAQPAKYTRALYIELCVW